MNKKIRFLVQSAIIAALYAALTLVCFPFSFGMLQVRISEALTVLPFFFPAAIPGLTLGCIIANLWSRFGFLDVIIGSSATLVAAFVTYSLRKFASGKYLAPLPPVIFNALGVGFTIAFMSFRPESGTFALYFAINALWVGIGEFISCYALGLPLILILNKNKQLLSRYF